MASGYFKNFVYSADYTSTIVYFDDSTTPYSGAYIARGVTLTSQQGVGISGNTGGQTVILEENAAVAAFYQTISLSGGNDAVTVEAGGIVRSFISAAVILTGDGSVLKNKGTITGGRYDSTSLHAAFVTPKTETGLSTVVNSGLIQSDYIALGRGYWNVGTLVVTNSGRIEGDTAFRGSDTVDKVTNTGTIVGTVTMNGGADLLDTRVGTIRGTIDLGAGADTAYGSAAADTILGGADNDLIQGNAGKDILNGGAGIADTVDYREKTVAVQVTLTGPTASTVLVNGVAEDTITYFERAYGGSAGDKLIGDGQANLFYGYGGNDTISGGAGNDILAGGLGNDVLTGGTNGDTFRFDAALGTTNVDSITDFSHTDDTIQLENAIFTALGTATGPLNPAAFLSKTSGHTATTTSQKIIYDQSNGELWYDATGSTNGATDAKLFAKLTTHPANVDYTDFTIV